MPHQHNHHSTQVSADLIWEITRTFWIYSLRKDNNAELYDRKPECVLGQAQDRRRSPVLSRSLQSDEHPLSKGKSLSSQMENVLLTCEIARRFRQRQSKQHLQNTIPREYERGSYCHKLDADQLDRLLVLSLLRARMVVSLSSQRRPPIPSDQARTPTKSHSLVERADASEYTYIQELHQSNC
jgi:hypothetical protein